MTAEMLRKILEEGVECVYASRAGENDTIRGCYTLTFDRRKGFHSVERKWKQIRKTAADTGVVFLLFKSEKIEPASGLYAERIIRELPEEDSELEEYMKRFPRYDLTVRVQMQRILKKIGFFR